jgi:hypothetical protein
MPNPTPDTFLRRLRAWYDAYAAAGHGTAIVACQHGHEAHWAGDRGEYVPLHAGDLLDAIERLEHLDAQVDFVPAIEQIRARAEDRQIRTALKQHLGLGADPGPTPEADVFALLAVIDQLDARITPITPADQFELFDVVARFVDHEEDACDLDHHGNCKMHGKSEPCVIKQGRDLLARLRDAATEADWSDDDQQAWNAQVLADVDADRIFQRDRAEAAERQLYQIRALLRPIAKADPGSMQPATVLLDESWPDWRTFATSCLCPAGMSHHAVNCPAAPNQPRTDQGPSRPGPNQQNGDHL